MSKKNDFDAEAKRLFERLNLPDPTEKRGRFDEKFDVPDVVWVHPETGAMFFIGNLGSAKNLEVLTEHKIFHIINCMNDDNPDNEFEDDERFTYLNFEIYQDEYDGDFDDA